MIRTSPEDFKAPGRLAERPPLPVSTRRETQRERRDRRERDATRDSLGPRGPAAPWPRPSEPRSVPYLERPFELRSARAPGGSPRLSPRLCSPRSPPLISGLPGAAQNQACAEGARERAPP